MNFEELKKWIERYTEGDRTYPYQAMRWYEEERKKRPLSADEQKTVLWLKKTYGIDGLDGNNANKFRRS